MPGTLSRRSFTAASAGVALALPMLPNLRPFALTALAQGTDLASLGLPTIDVTITDAGFEGLPTELTAGRYLLTVSLGEGITEGACAFVTTAEGTPIDEFSEIVGAVGEAAATPGAEEEEGPIPDVVYSWRFAGGASPSPEGPAQAIIDLVAADWAAWGDDPASPIAPVIIPVTGEWPADLAEPASDISVIFADYSITVEGSLTAGDHLLTLTDEGAEPHFMAVFHGPDGMTDKQFGDFFMGDMGMAATPGPEGPLDPATLMPIGFTATQSAGVTQWVPMSFAAGTYGAVCFFPTIGTGAPHVMMGMHKVFTIA